MNVHLFILLAALIAPSPSVDTPDSSGTHARYEPVTRFDPKRNAAGDVAASIVEAKRSGRRILLDVGGEWCVWCHRLDRLFEENEDLAHFLHDKFVVVKINYSPENKNAEFLSRFPKIPGYPHLFVLEDDGTLLRSQDTGELESGKGHDREKVFAFLRRWAP